MNTADASWYLWEISKQEELDRCIFDALKKWQHIAMRSAPQRKPVSTVYLYSLKVIERYRHSATEIEM